MKILLFGITKDIFGSSSIEMSLKNEEITSQNLLDELKEKYPDLNRLKSIALAVNGEHAMGDEVLKEQDEVALIPPMSGG